MGQTICIRCIKISFILQSVNASCMEKNKTKTRKLAKGLQGILFASEGLCCLKDSSCWPELKVYNDNDFKLCVLFVLSDDTIHDLMQKQGQHLQVACGK